MSLKNKNVTLSFFLVLSLLSLSPSYAAEVYLKNGDKITGDIVKQDDKKMSIKTDAMGLITLKKDFITRIEGVADEPKKEVKEVAKKKEIIWTREASAGFNATRGNTKTNQLLASFLINRSKVRANDITLKGNAYYSEVDDESDAQKWYSMGRYAFSFGSTKHWYNFYRLEYDHDRFAEINYRLIPGTGVGYWFFDDPKLKLLAELGMGWEHTNYREEKDSTNDIIWLPRAFFESELIKNIKLRGDLYLYPTVNFDEYRLHAESALLMAINKIFSLKFALINDYNSDPPSDTEKHDVRLESSLVASF
jgi:putative salt-induced outer membrane protein YdiY